MAGKGDIKKNDIQPDLFKSWIKLDYAEATTKASKFKKHKSKEYLASGNYPVIDQGDQLIAGFINSSKNIYQGEIPIIIFGDHTRKVKYIDFKFAVGADGTKIIDPNAFYHPKFFYYYLKTLEIPDFGYSRHFKVLKELDYPLPSISEQERIVAKLDSLFARLDKIKTSLDKIPELLQDFRQQILTQAVTGKLTKIWRGKVGIKRLDHREINKERQLEFESEITSLLKQGKRKQKLSEYSNRGYNSIGWAITNVESASLLIVDCLHNTPKFIIEGTNYVVDTTCIKPFRIDWNKARRIDDITYQEWTSRLEPREGDIIFSREGTIGIAVKVPKNKRVCIGQRTMIFRFGSYIIPRYAEILFNSQHFKNLYQPFIKGVASQHLNIRDIRKLEISIPSYTEQLKIVEIVDSLLKKADKMEDQFKISRKLIDNLPQSILQRAFKGELVPQLDSDGDARELLREIEGLKSQTNSKKEKAKNKEYTIEKDTLNQAAENSSRYKKQ